MKTIVDESGPFQVNVGDNSKKEEEKEPKELLPFLKKKIEDISRHLQRNTDGKNNGSIGIILGRMYQTILFELDKKK